MKANRSLADFENKPIEDGMTASDEYFVELEADLLERLDLEEKLLGVEADGFQIEDLSLKPIEDQIDFRSVSKSGSSKLRTLYTRYGQWAAVFLVFIGCLSIYQLSNTDAEAYSTEGFTKELSEAYLQDQIYFLTDSDLELIMDKNDIDQHTLELTERELEDYLMINEAYNLN
jgi:hypothetical protein